MKIPGLLPILAPEGSILKPTTIGIPILERRSQTRVGTAEDNEVVLDQSHLKTRIAPYHCIFRRNGEIVTVEGLGENLVEVDSQVVYGPTIVHEGNFIAIGNFPRNETSPWLYFKFTDLTNTT